MITLVAGQPMSLVLWPQKPDGTPTPGASVFNVSWSVSDSNILLLIPNQNGTAILSATAAGTASVKATATVVDSPGVTNVFEQTWEITVETPCGTTSGLGLTCTVL